MLFVSVKMKFFGFAKINAKIFQGFDLIIAGFKPNLTLEFVVFEVGGEKSNETVGVDFPHGFGTEKLYQLNGWLRV